MDTAPDSQRVVVTGLGVVHGLGQTVDAFWASVVAGRNGIDRVSLFDPTGYSSQIGAEVRGWDGPELQLRARRARELVDDYFNAVLRVAQLAAYTRLFSLWHVLHVPFVFLMVLCAIAHVVAVHAY